MINTTANTATNTNATTETINENYEYIQYNEHLRIIHSIKDDMFQVQSIITNDWFESKTTKEIIDKMSKISTVEFFALAEIYKKRDELPNVLRRFYINLMLINNVTIWASLH